MSECFVVSTVILNYIDFRKEHRAQLSLTMSFKRLVAILAPGVITAGVSAAAILPNTVLLDKTKDVTQSYR